MSLAEQINEHLRELPESKQAEVLDFVSYLSRKDKAEDALAEETAWSSLSISTAMQGLEDEPEIYALSDIKE